MARSVVIKPHFLVVDNELDLFMGGSDNYPEGIIDHLIARTSNYIPSTTNQATVIRDILTSDLMLPFETDHEVVYLCNGFQAGEEVLSSSSIRWQAVFLDQNLSDNLRDIGSVLFNKIASAEHRTGQKIVNEFYSISGALEPNEMDALAGYMRKLLGAEDPRICKHLGKNPASITDIIVEARSPAPEPRGKGPLLNIVPPRHRAGD